MDYTVMRNHRMQGHAAYWMGSPFAQTITTQQIHVSRIPPVPGGPSPFLHTTTLDATGAWPHLALRQREDMPPGFQALRRILQDGDTTPPRIITSAEELYKRFDDHAPATLTGLQSAEGEITA